MDTPNPLLADWDTPHGLPPFDRLEPSQFAPAFDAAMRRHRDELDAIAAQTEPPSFENTVAAFDRSGRLLSRVEAVFYNLTASQTSPELQAVQREMAAPLAAHASAVFMHQGLFRRIDALHEQAGRLDLQPEQRRLLDRLHLDFVRAGARFEPAAQARYAEVMQRLAERTTEFGQNVLHDESSFRMVLRDDADLAGLPESLRAAMRQAAADAGIADAHVLTLARSLVVPFLTFSARRDLREQAWRGWVGRGEHDGAHDNRPVARAILALRREQAKLHGEACYADYALADTMAGSPAAVQKLFDETWPRALAAVERERQALQEVARDEALAGRIEAWDWRWLAEKVRQRRYALDDAELKPYFPLDRMVQAAFDCAGRLFGISFAERADLPVYHPDVCAYEVRRADGSLLGVFLHDNFARASKRSGAWMSALRWQCRNGGDVQPVVLNNNNFAKGAPGEPTLLSLDDARTLFHEFGHGLHGLLSDVRYERMSGTQVLRDFVELPSQLFEHWLGEREVLKRHARHWQTGEPIPDALIDRIEAAKRFNQGYETVRYLASAIVDMAVHSLRGAEPPADLCAFEAQVLRDAGLPDAVGMNHRLVHFQHLFSGSGYAAGYYVYLWAEVLDADGYDAFLEAGDPFDPKVARSLLQNIYARGDSVEPGAAFAAFRGRAPSVQPMLKKRGLVAAD